MCHFLVRLGIAMLVGIALPAQGRLQAPMEAFANAVHAIDQALAEGNRAAIAAPLAALEQTRKQLAQHREPRWPHERAEPWLERLAAAIARLREPDPTATRDAYDWGELRASCTGCHLELRDGNAERGLFPNRGGAAFGRIEMRTRDGTRSDDASGVVVFLEREEATAAPLPRAPAISQHGRRFHPSILAVTVGTTVRFPNDDIVFHNVFSLSRGNAFDLQTYGKGIERTHQMRNAGLVKVHCNIHPDMVASVLVLPTARYAITDSQGFWSIPDVPVGTYTLRTWQALADGHSQPLTLDSNTAVAVNLVITETKPRVQHTDKFGKPYKTNY